MNNDTESYKQMCMPQAKPKRRKLHFLFLGSMIVSCLLTIGMLAFAVRREVVRKRHEVAKASKTVYDITSKTPVLIPLPQKSTHVIFRVGGEEIFRFTFDGDRKDANYSFEVREGGS